MQAITPYTKKLSVLYVEDDLVSQEQLCSIFEMIYASVTTAFDGEDAWEKYQIDTFDIVITDISMPRMNGIELSEKILTKNPKQIIIIISAHNDSENILEAINLGVDAFVQKPIEKNKLYKALNKTAIFARSSQMEKYYQEQLEKQLLNKTQQLKQQLLSDDLTGLLNRKAMVLTSKNINKKVLAIINIDSFDGINTVYGHENGDKVITEVANLLKTNLQSEQHLYRIGGDEFAILFENHTLQHVKDFMQKLQETITLHPVKLADGTKIFITTTIGIADGSGCLLPFCAIAIKEARLYSVGTINIYKENSPTQQLQEKTRTCLPRLKKAIENRLIVPYFQPIVNNKTKKIEKFECLARLVYENEVISPFHFIDIAEKTGFLTDITKLMIDKSFMAFADNSYEFSINISEKDLENEYLVEFIETKAKEYNIDLSRLVLEILEDTNERSIQKCDAQLMALKAKGCKIALDDFGVKSSNFERVHKLHVDYIKIDGSFIKEMDTNEKSYNIVKTICHFAHSVDAKVIAEFVHSKEIQRLVEALEIEYTQGYYYGKPNQIIQKEIQCN